MARPVRIEFPDAIYHVTTRGEAGENIFADEQDRRIFLDVLEEVVSRNGWLVHAYVLMNNHYHLLLETPQPNLSRGMRQLNGVYTQRYNGRHAGSGSVFQGRFKAILVERDGYLLELCKYVVLNPLRLKAARNISRYKWSSYPATAGEVKTPGWLHTGWILGQFARSTAAAQQKYAKFVTDASQQHSPLLQVKSQILLGGSTFLKKMQQRLAGAQAAGAGAKKSRRPALAAMFPAKGSSKALRNQAIHLAYQAHGYTMSEIAQAAKIHFSTVSKIIKAAERAA